MSIKPRRCFWLLLLTLLPYPAFATPPVEIVKTPGGLTAWLIEDHSLPLVTLRATFRHGGAAYADPAKPGLPRLAADALTEGAGDLSAEAYSAALQEQAINLNFGIDYDQFGFSLSALSEQFGRGLELASLALLKPRLEAADLARLKQQLGTQHRFQLQSPGYLAELRFRKEAYGTHPYAQPLDADEKLLDAYTADDIRAFLNGALNRDDLVLAVVGDISKEQLTALLDERFGALPKAPLKSELTPLPLPNLAAPIEVAAPVPQAFALFALPGIARSDPDFYAAYVMNYLLGGGDLESRLSAEVRKKRGLTYGISTSLVESDASRLLEGSLATKASQVDQAVGAVKGVFQAAYDHGFTAAELTQAQAYLTGSFPLAIDSDESLVSFLMVMQIQQLGPDYLEKRNRLMQAVTLDQLNRAAKRLLDPAHMLVVEVGGAKDNAANEGHSDADHAPKP